MASQKAEDDDISWLQSSYLTENVTCNIVYESYNHILLENNQSFNVMFHASMGQTTLTRTSQRHDLWSAAIDGHSE